jgi:hypothetical protein
MQLDIKLGAKTVMGSVTRYEFSVAPAAARNNISADAAASAHDCGSFPFANEPASSDWIIAKFDHTANSITKYENET